MPVDFNRVRSAIDKLGLGEFAVQNFGSSDTALIRLPLKEGVSSAQLSERVMGALKADDPGVTQRRVEFVGPAGRQGARTRTARSRCCCVVDRHRDLPGVPLRVELRRRGDHRQPARRRHHPGLLRASSSGSSRCRCWPRCSRCSATRSTSRSSSSTGSARTSARCARPPSRT